ncbi:SDR family oxidoreductase [Streptomyces sp. NBC_00237]|uniref:SDR family NAD(P)-dependent oxidoreductase n=1 Tax=Streptomyces sp. NBC_00237 TaxID=2975687 RepID=UPI002257F0B4|nr:SDR family NAD(P)-dependent oxidoreductase [Streptomyces sp. NBC_00237]MCX5202768.1 SDR family oxidoreductase [Streptomyces sp. NBC_00237]
MTRFGGYGVLVTGAGQGIGAATARRFAVEGAGVLVTDRDPLRAEEVAEGIREAGGTALAQVCDVVDRGAVETAVDRAFAAFGRLDVLVNNAYACHAEPPLFEDTPDEPWYEDFEVSLHGAFRCTRAALPHLAAADGRGAVVNIGSVNAEQHFGNHAYSAAKAGLASLTRTLAVQCAPRGVRVNVVEPGTVRTGAWDGRQTRLDDLPPHYPLGRLGEPEDIAAAVTFLASADATWITGVTLPVDGGLLVSNMAMRRTLDGN